MGRAIVRNPEVFLFDEPLSNLDATLRATLRAEIGKLLATLGATALYVTHDQTEAMTLGHRIAVLRAGRLEQLDTPRVIYERPATAFVAGFFGAPAMNLLSAVRDGARAWVGGQALEAPPGEQERLICGVRPEHVTLVPTTTRRPPSPGRSRRWSPTAPSRTSRSRSLVAPTAADARLRGAATRRNRARRVSLRRAALVRRGDGETALIGRRDLLRWAPAALSLSAFGPAACRARSARPGRATATLWFSYGGKNREVLERLVAAFNASRSRAAW
jgi:ABC-type Fe3+/spermidine/putrescine transport system ATPase subunit